MSKERINRYIPIAYDALRECKIAVDGKVPSALRGQIASFGAAVTMGSLLPAIAFFSVQGGSKSNREYLMKAIYWILLQEKIKEGAADTVDNLIKDFSSKKEKYDNKSLFEYVKGCDEKDSLRECVIDAAVAIKLAMNAYELTDDAGKGGNDGKEE